MEKNYNEFCEISIYDTGLIRKSSHIAGVFKKNNIETLDDLFKLDDELAINYGVNTMESPLGGSEQHVRAHIHGIVRLIRYKYLNEELFADTLYENKYNLEPRYFEYTSTRSLKFTDFLNRNGEGYRINSDFKNLGFNDIEIRVICNYTYNLNGGNFEFGSMFLNVAEGIMGNLKEYNQRLFPNKLDQSIFLEKIRLISDYIKKDKRLNDSTDKSDISAKNLIEEEKRLILELNKLNERRLKIADRISNIREELSGNKSIR